MTFLILNKIIVKRKENLSALLDKYTILEEETGELKFAFNNVIKMPEDLPPRPTRKDATGLKLYLTRVNPEVDYYGTNEEKMDKASYEEIIKELGETPVLSSEEISELINRWGGKEKELLELGETQIAALIKYGAINSSKWKEQHWGTYRWSSYMGISKDGKSLEFDSFSPSVEIVREISRQNPKIKITFLYADRDIGETVGWQKLRRGEILSEQSFIDWSKEAYEFALHVWPECRGELEELNYKEDNYEK